VELNFIEKKKKRALDDSDLKKNKNLKQPTHHHQLREKKSIINLNEAEQALTMELLIISDKRKSAVVPSPSADNISSALQDSSNDKSKDRPAKPYIPPALQLKLAVAADKEYNSSKGGFLTSRPSNPLVTVEETTTNTTKTEPETEPVEMDLPQGMSNPLLRTVIMRLQYSVAFGCWEVRLVCLRALAKIAFLSNFEVKLHLYSFFQTICKDQSVGLAAEALPIFLTLHKIFIAFSDYVKMGTNLSVAKKLELNNEIRQYCEIPPEFHPLGIYSTLKKTKSVVTKENDDSSLHRHSVIIPPSKK